MGKLTRPAVVISIALLAIPGCKTSKALELKGVVVTSQNLGDSFLGTSIREMDGDLTPIVGAKVRLSFDEVGEALLQGYEAESSSDGSYTINLNAIPPSQTRYGNDYYLIVEKDGYKPLTYHISIGPRGIYMMNTVFLRCNPKK
jgi:hypothetical protein